MYPMALRDAMMHKYRYTPYDDAVISEVTDAALLCCGLRVFFFPPTEWDRTIVAAITARVGVVIDGRCSLRDPCVPGMP